MNGALEAAVSIGTAIIGVAIIATLVSNQSNTSGVIQAFGSAFSNALAVAQSPVTGNTVNIDTSYPNSGGSSSNSFGSSGLSF